MNLTFVAASARRIFQQLGHDKRTIVLLLFFPSVLMTLLRFVFNDNEKVFDRVGGPMLAVFPFVIMFLVSCIVMLRERSSGTLERLMTLPIHKVDIIFGYALAFGIIALLQAAITMFVAVHILGLDISGQLYWLFLVAGVDAILGMALGLLASSLARTEFQAVQFMPVFAFPQILLCGLFVPREHMHPLLEGLANILPLSYAVDAVNRVVEHTLVDETFFRNIGIVALVSLAALILGALSIRRRT